MTFAVPNSPASGADGASLWQSLPIFFRQVAQPIRFLLEDPAVIEIMCNRPGEVWVERTDQPRMVRHLVVALDERAIRGLAQMIAGSTQQSVNEETPLLSAAMPRGERFQAVLAPVAAAGGAFAIRKQVIRDMSLDDYIALGGFDSIRVSGPARIEGEFSDLDRELVGRLVDPSPAARRNWFRFAVENRVTMLISGGTSSGKTTFFNGLLKDVPIWERLISIEDTRELRPPQPNTLALIASKGGQGRAKTTIQDCLEAALRLRPDRIFMGEIRGAEAFSFLQAVNTGHPGSMSTLHADSPVGAYERLAMATMQAGLGLSKAELLEFVRFVAPVVVQISRDPVNSKRGVTEIYFNKWSPLMKRYEKIILVLAGSFVAAAALFFAWSFNYAAASFFLLKSTEMWKSFTTDDLLMPAKQAWVYLANPRVRSLIDIAAIATLVETAVATGGILFLIFRPWEVRPPGDGSRFATLKDLEKSRLTRGEPGKSILLGTFGNGKKAVDIRYSGDSHFFVNGPSRSGKGRGFVMVNLLEYAGSVIVLDVKLENFVLTGAARLAMGQKCFVFAPGSQKSHRWNPLDFVRDWPERSTDLINLATTLLPIGEKEEGYWKQTARGLMASLIGYVLESKTMEGRRNLRSVLRLFSTGKRFSEVLEAIIANEPELNDFILAGFRQHLGRDEDQRPSFEGHIVTVLAPFNNLLMAAACSASDFDIRDLRRKPFSLFIASPVSDFGTVEPLIRLLIQQIHDVMLRRLPDPEEPHKVLMMLDEFYQFERLPEIVKRAPLVAGYGLTIALVAQNIPQIDERYGQKTRDALIGNMDIKLFVAVGDETTAKFVSANLGRKYEEREGWGRNRGVLTSKTASQGRFELVPLMEPDAVQRLDDEKTILQIRSGHGAILNKLNFYTQDRFIARRRQVEPYARDLSIPEIVLQPEWPLFAARPKVARQVKAEQAPQSGTIGPDHDAIVLTRARAVFADPGGIMHAYRHAVMAADDQAVADLLFRLRTAPEAIGPLHGNRNRLDANKGRQARAAALDAVWPLRDAITAARWATIAARLERTANGAELFFSPGTPLPPAPVGGEDEDDENNRLELFFQDGSAVLTEIEELVDDDIAARRAADAGALTRALTNLRTGFEQSMSEPEEVNALRLADIATARQTL